MPKYYIYIDDSGNPGLTSASHSDNFIIAAVVVVGKENRDALEDAIDKYRMGLGWNGNEELKFNKTSKDAIRLAIKTLSKYDYSAYAIVLNKSNFNRSKLPSTKRESVMMFVIKELLMRLALDDVEVAIDGSYGPKFVKQSRPYLRHALEESGTNISRIRFSDSRNCLLIQLADLVAGSVARSLTQKTDAKDYIKLFGRKLKKIYKL